jgi:hypothetical protein
MFAIMPQKKSSWISKLTSLFRDKYDMHLVCECPGQFHIQKSDQPYVLDIPKERWVKMAPILIFVLKTIRIVFDELPESVVTMFEQLATDPLSIFPELKEKLNNECLTTTNIEE